MIDRTTLTALAGHWPEFDWLTCQEPSANHHEYLRFYQLDFLSAGLADGYRFGQICVDNRKIAVQAWQKQKAKGTVVCVHGYWEHAGFLHPLIEFCLAQEFNVVVFDEPGHGLSEGEPVTIDDFSEYTSTLAAVVTCVESRWQNNPIITIGHSNGGAVALDYFYSHQAQHVQKTIVLSPLIRIWGWPSVALGLRITPNRWQKLPRVIGHAGSHGKSFAQFVNSDPLQVRYCSRRWLYAAANWKERFLALAPQPGNLVFMQGTHDTTVDWTFNLKALQQKHDGLRAYIIKGGYHNLINEIEPYRSEFYAHLQTELNELF